MLLLINDLFRPEISFVKSVAIFSSEDVLLFPVLKDLDSQFLLLTFYLYYTCATVCPVVFLNASLLSVQQNHKI